jgi:UPF0755 protein
MSRKKIIIMAVAAVLLIGGVLIYPKFNIYLKGRNTTTNASKKELYIKNEINLEGLANLLEKEGFIDNRDAFIAVGEYKAINEKNIALGKYVVEPGTSYRNLLNGFKKNASGNGNAEVEIAITFTNCKVLDDVAAIVSSKTNLNQSELLEFMKSEATLNKYGFTIEQFPAMFIPNTYNMYYDITSDQFISRMAEEFKKFWTAERKSKMAAIGLKSQSDVVTLASIVYSEQDKVKEEWPIIAGLYLNRIKQGIKLQSDPTFKYCWGDKLDGVQRLLNVHRNIDCPYNTYKIKGLPPGPICIPPSEVVDAVLNRDNNNYIFMMAKPDYSGKHDFTVQYADHERLAAIYQKWLSNELKQN